LAATTLRVDVSGVPALEGLSFATTGDRVLVLGAARALFEAAAGLRTIARGALRVEDAEPATAAQGGAIACAPLDPSLPPDWTVAQYARWSARLAGRTRSEAASLATDALERLQLAPAARTKLAVAALPVRRGAVLAAALATGAKTILVEDPTPGLADEAARPLARVLSRAVAGRRSVIFAARIALDSPLALAADEALVFDGSRVAAQGAPAEIAAAERTLLLRVHGNAIGFARAVEGAGGRADVTTGAPPPAHVQVHLGPLAPRDLLRIAAESSAVVVELRPLARSFA
jgi:ABC-type multidrug transport system ATPase subunit